MSSARRAYDVIRAYVSHGWEQFSDRDEAEAQDELRAAIENPLPPSGRVTRNDNQPEPTITLEAARKLFDLAPNAGTRQISDAYDSLRKATDPAKFTEGSDPWQRARLLARRLDAARNILMENVDPTVRRFERLEIE